MNEGNWAVHAPGIQLLHARMYAILKPSIMYNASTDHLISHNSCSYNSWKTTTPTEQVKKDYRKILRPPLQRTSVNMTRDSFRMSWWMKRQCGNYNSMMSPNGQRNACMRIENDWHLWSTQHDCGQSQPRLPLLWLLMPQKASLTSSPSILTECQSCPMHISMI